VKTQTPRKRPKSPVIQLVEENAPWMLISKAALDSGLTELLIRQSGIFLKKFGTADYICPTELNAWILKDGKSDQH